MSAIRTYKLQNLREVLESLGIGAAQIPPDREITGPAKLSEAKSHHISFLANMKYEDEIFNTGACAVLVSRDYVPRKAVNTLLVPVDDPYRAMISLLEYFSQGEVPAGIDPGVTIPDDADIGKDVFIGPYTIIGKRVSIGRRTRIYGQVYIGNGVRIGKDTVIYAGVKIYDDCDIGDGVIIHANTVIGADGFGFAPDEEGRMKKIPQIGNVVIKDRAEIGSNCSIDRATMGSTVIGVNTKLDNLIQVGHNAVIDGNTVIAAQSGVSGSTKIGRNCMIGGQVGFAGHLQIAPGTRINAKSGVSKSVKDKGARLNGIPAFNFTDSLRSQAVYRRLPELEKKIREIEEILSLLRK